MKIVTKWCVKGALLSDFEHHIAHECLHINFFTLPKSGLFSEMGWVGVWVRVLIVPPAYAHGGA